MDGSNGLDGVDGTSGTPGSMDPNSPSPCGNGSDCTNESDGKDGAPGRNAPPLDLRVALQPGSHPLLQVSVSALGDRKLYLVDPRGGSLTVKADGGQGGSGGKGWPRWPRRLAGHGNPQRTGRFERPRRTERIRWLAGQGRQHHHNLRPPSQAPPERHPSFQPQ
jgi:hypothetical protein